MIYIWFLFSVHCNTIKQIDYITVSSLVQHYLLLCISNYACDRFMIIVIINLELNAGFNHNQYRYQSYFHVRMMIINMMIWSDFLLLYKYLKPMVFSF